MVPQFRPALRPLLLGSLAALVCGSVAAVGMLPRKVEERARMAEISATGAQLQIAVRAPARPAIPKPAGKLATMPDQYADAASVAVPPPVSGQPAVRPRVRSSVSQADEVLEEDEELAVLPRYATASTRWRTPPPPSVDDEDDEPLPVYPPTRERYRPYREEGRWDDRRPEPRILPGENYAPGPYLGERYDPSWRR